MGWMTIQAPTTDGSVPNEIDFSSISRNQLARDCDVDAGHISRILAGKRRPSVNLSIRIARSLGVSLEQLYDELERQFPGMLSRQLRRPQV